MPVFMRRLAPAPNRPVRLVLLVLCVPSAGAWTWPVAGPVLAGLHVRPCASVRRGSAPRHRHRRDSPGAPVLAPAAGVVSFAGDGAGERHVVDDRDGRRALGDADASRLGRRRSQRRRRGGRRRRHASVRAARPRSTAPTCISASGRPPTTRAISIRSGSCRRPGRRGRGSGPARAADAWRRCRSLLRRRRPLRLRRPLRPHRRRRRSSRRRRAHRLRSHPPPWLNRPLPSRRR